MAKSENSLPAAVTFRADPAKNVVRHRDYLLLWITVVSLPILGTFLWYLFPGVSWTEFWSVKSDFFVMNGGVLLGYAVIQMVVWQVHSHPRLLARLYLRLDHDGFTDSRRFRSRRWAWCELPPFAFEANELPPNIAFHWPGQKPGSLRKGEITDLYDAPLDEIAAKLNDYREKALAESSRSD